MHKLITVRGNNGNRVALWERNPLHPGGEAFISGEREVTVAHTHEVAKAIHHGALVFVGEASAKEAEKGPVTDVSNEPVATLTSDPEGSEKAINEVVSQAQADALAEAGLDTPAKVRAATDAELDAVSGIGDASIKALREAYGHEAPAGDETPDDESGDDKTPDGSPADDKTPDGSTTEEE